MSTPAVTPITQPNTTVQLVRRKLRWGVILVAVADLALAGWLLSPKAPSVVATKQQLTNARADLARMQRESRQLNLLQGRVHRSQQQMQEVMAAGMPLDTESNSKLLNELDKLALASQAGVAAQSYKPDTKVVAGLRRVDIELQVAGDYPAVVRFLNRLERSPMFFLLNQVSVTGGSRTATAANANLIKLDVKVEAYEQVSGATPAPARHGAGATP